MESFRYKVFDLFLVAVLVTVCVSSAPNQQAPSTTATTTTTTTQTSASSSLSPSSSTKPAPTQTPSKSISSLVATSASSLSSFPSLVGFRSAGVSQDELAGLEAKNAFADDSLWRIPVHLERDFGGAKGNLASSGTEDEQDDEDRPLAPAQLQQSSSAAPAVISASTDLKTAAGFHYPTHGHAHQGHHGQQYPTGDHYGGKYFQYASVPYPYTWDFGYRRGNPYHTIERYEHGKGPHFQTKVKWSDKYGGYGVHVWDYNHDDHHSNHYAGHHGSHYDSHSPSSDYSGHHHAHYADHH